MGNNATATAGLAGYTFRIQGAPVTVPAVIEVGGYKLGTKSL